MTNKDCEGISMLEVIERKVATFEPKLSSLESLQQEMANRIIKVEDSVEKQVAEITQMISNMEGNWLEDANTVLATGDDNLTDRLDNLEKMVGQCNNDLTPGSNDVIVAEDVFDTFLR